MLDMRRSRKRRKGKIEKQKEEKKEGQKRNRWKSKKKNARYEKKNKTKNKDNIRKGRTALHCARSPLRRPRLTTLLDLGIRGRLGTHLPPWA